MENKLFGAVKLEDLNKPAEKPADKTVEESEANPAETPEKPADEMPKMGEQKEEAKPAEVVVPKTPDQVEKKVEEEQDPNATAFRMDMMVEAEEEVSGAKGIFSTGQPVEKTVTPIESANTWHDKTSFKEKTISHAERVFETDEAIKEEQEEKKKEEAEKASAEEGAKRAEKAWGKGIEERAEPAPVGIFTSGPKKSGGLGGFFDKIKAVLTKPVGKNVEKK